MYTINEYYELIPKDTKKFIHNAIQFYYFYKHSQSTLEKNKGKYIQILESNILIKDRSNQSFLFDSFLLTIMNNEELNIYFKRVNYSIYEDLFNKELNFKKIRDYLLRHEGILTGLSEILTTLNKHYYDVCNGKDIASTLEEEHIFDELYEYLVPYTNETRLKKLNPMKLFMENVNMLSMSKKDGKIKEDDIIDDSCSLTYKTYKKAIAKYRKNERNIIPIDKRTEMLEKEKIEKLNVSSPADVLAYGENLRIHADYVNEEFLNINEEEVKKDSKEFESIYLQVMDAKKREEKRKSILAKLFNQEKNEESIITEDLVDELSEIIDSYMDPICDDIKKFYDLIEYFQVYINKTNEYLNELNSKYVEVSSILENCTDDVELQKYGTIKQALDGKINTLDKSIVIVKQYICRLYLLIQNNLSLTASLELSRDVLLPLVRSEIIISRNINNQKTGYKITAGVLSLLNSVISQNTVGIEDSMKEMKILNIPEEQIELINSNLLVTLDKINELKQSEVKRLELK